MANTQQLFEIFHSRIRTYYEINKTLQEKKDIIVNRVKGHLAKNKRPSCEPFIQGSYKMKVGICALKGMDYDIDVGLCFSFDEGAHSAEEVRKWVFEAVDGHTETVETKTSCIRVIYSEGYHVDLVAYARWDDANGVEQHRLAHKAKGWRPANPPKLVQIVADARKPFSETEDLATQTDQFRRVVRYLKRWNDHAIPKESGDKPSGIALVLLTKTHLTSPALFWDGTPDDRQALEIVATAAAQTYGRISAIKPTPEGEDLFAGLSDTAMDNLKKRFTTLSDALIFAKNANDGAEACKELKKVLGEDFPCPDPEEEGMKKALKTAAPAIVTSSSSA
jgi:hypothetical protein